MQKISLDYSKLYGFKTLAATSQNVEKALDRPSLGDALGNKLGNKVGLGKGAKQS